MASLQSSNKGLCLICGDYANGVHYNVLSCEGCKSFFLRSIKSKATFTCSENKKCEMDLYTRRHCPACRMKKCMELGMNAEKVWDDMRLKKRKPLVRTKKKKMSHVIEPVTPPSESSSCSESVVADTQADPELKPDQQSLSQLLETSFIQSKQVYKELAPQLSPTLQQTLEKFTIGGMSPRRMADTVAQTLMGGARDRVKPRLKRSASTGSKQGKPKRSKRQQEVKEDEDSDDKVDNMDSFALSFLFGKSSQPKLEICKDLVTHAMDLFAVTVKQIIFFAKSIPGFSQLTCDDQAALIRAAIMETIIIRCTERFDTSKNLLVSDINEGEYGLNLIFQLGYKTFTEPFFKFMREMKYMNLRMEEYALLQAAIILQSDRPDLKNAELVEKLQFPLILTLQACTKRNHPEDPGLFAKLMLKMVTLRDIDHVHSKDLMDMKLQEQEFTPLVQELFGL